MQNLQENIAALKIKLAQEDIDEIRRLAVVAASTIGERYPAQWQALSFADTPPLSKA